MNIKYIKEILSLLSANSYITAGELSKHLNVSEKTIRIKVREINYELEKLNIKIFYAIDFFQSMTYYINVTKVTM